MRAPWMHYSENTSAAACAEMDLTLWFGPNEDEYDESVDQRQWRERRAKELCAGCPVQRSVDRAVHSWIAEEHSKSTVKNSLAVLVKVMEQALRDGIIDRNPTRVTGWQREFAQVEDELDDPRSLALPNWQTLTRLADALVANSYDEYEGWGDVVIFAACTAARIGEVSGCRVKDIDAGEWRWQVRRQITNSPGGHVDKGTKGKRAREVPFIEEVHELVLRRIAATGGSPDARLFAGPRGGRITRGTAGRDRLGCSGHEARIRASTPSRPPAHGSDVDG